VSDSLKYLIDKIKLMASDSNRLEAILPTVEIYPDDPNYPFPSSVGGSTAEKVAYWFKQFKSDWKSFPKSSQKSKTTWSDSNSSGRGGSWGDEWQIAAKSRINNFPKSDDTKSGFKVFREITGYYQLHTNDDDTNKRQARRVKQILDNLTQSEYGLIDPLTGKDAVIDLESKGGRLNYFFQNPSFPSTICYTVLEAEVAPLVMTDTLLESNLRGYIYEDYISNGRIPDIKQVFPAIMQKGKVSQVFLKMRDDIPTLRGDISVIVDEMANMENINEVVNGFVPESPEYGSVGELKSVTKSISLKNFLALPFTNASVKTTIQDMRPPVDGMKQGKNWPKNDINDWIIHITQNPVEVMQKSTNRAWSSCENMGGGGYRFGCWSDFKNGNGIALFYRASDLLDSEGSLRIDQSKAKGRTMLRWGMANVPSKGTQPRVGIETRIYNQSEIGGSVQKQLSAGLISIMQNAGIWDWNGTLNTPYTYHGYADRGGSGGRLSYPKGGSAGVSSGGLEVGGMAEAAIQLTYNTQLDISYGELQGIIEMNDSDEVFLNLAENPVCWNYHRIIGAFVRNLFGMYEDNNREVVLNLLLNHDYANPALLIPALESMELINPNFKSLANLDDVIFSFANHPRSNSEVHDTINTLFGDDAKLLYGLPNPPTLTPLGGPIWNSFSYPADSFWQPYVDMLSEIGIPESSGDIPENVIVEQFSRFGEWYAPVLERWAGLYTSAPTIVQSYETNGLGIGIWGANQLAYKLLHQPTISQTQFDTLLDIYLKINLLLETNSSGDSYESQMLVGTLNLITLNFNKPNYQGWELYGANPSEIPTYAKVKSYRPRTNETVNMILAFIYQQLLQSNNENEFMASVFSLYGGCKSSSEVEVFYNFITTIVSLNNHELVGVLGEDNTMELQAKLIPMLFLSAFKRTDMTKKGLRLLPQSAIPAIFALLTNNSFGEGYYNAIFYDFIPQNKYGEYIEHLATSNESKIKGERKPSSLSETMVFNILMNEDILEWVNITELASQIPANDDLFYVMEDVMLSYYLADMYNPEGEKPFVDLTIEQLNRNTEEHFEFNLLISNALPAIASMLLGFLKNTNTPDEIIERIIQKPRFNSVGYRRMFDYYGMGEDYFSNTVGGSFAEEFITPLTENINIKGRLLKYLYKNYPEQRQNLILNPNLVEARLFDDMGEQFPIKLLANYDVTKRAYMRHMRNTIKGLKLSPEYSFNATYHSWIDVLRNSINQSSLPNIAESFTNNIISRTDLKFIRAGRMRFPTNLPTAIDGPSAQNISRAGSIPDYPQIPDDGQPFAIFRGLNINLHTLNELSGLGEDFLNAPYEERPRPSITQSLSAINTLLVMGQINSNNIISLPVDDEGNPVMPEGNKPSDESLFLNKKVLHQTYDTQNIDIMMVFESEYVVNDEDRYAELGNYSTATLKGIQVGNSGSFDRLATNGGIGLMRVNLNKEVIRRAIMEFIELCPDGLEILGNPPNNGYKAKLNNSVYDWDGNNLVAEFISSEIFYNYLKSQFEDNSLVSNMLSSNSSTNPVYEWRDFFQGRQNSHNIGDRSELESLWQTIHNSIGTQTLGDLFMSLIMVNVVTNTNIRRIGGDSGSNYNPSVQIINGEYNLESLFGWIEPELRAVLTNYDSKGRFNDRLSAFLPDWLMVMSMDGLGEFTSPRNDSEVVDVPLWRLHFDNGMFNSMVGNIQEAIIQGEIKYIEYLDSISLFMETVDSPECVLFPADSPSGENALYGLQGLGNHYGRNALILKLMKLPDISSIQTYEGKMEMFSCGLYLFCGNQEYWQGLQFMESINSSDELSVFAQDFMWKSKENGSKGDELINLLISLDGNERSGLPSEEEAVITQGMRRAYSQEKINAVKKFISDNFSIGLKTYQKYTQVLTETADRQHIDWRFSGNEGLNKKVNNNATAQVIITVLFRSMVSGYIDYLRANALKLNYEDFILMVRLLSFDSPEAHNNTQNWISPEMIIALESLRDRNLPLFIQALRTTTIREDEEFIE